MRTARSRTGTAPPSHSKTSPSIGTTSRATASLIELKYHFNGKENAKKFCYAYKNVAMMTKNEEKNSR